MAWREAGAGVESEPTPRSKRKGPHQNAPNQNFPPLTRSPPIPPRSRGWRHPGQRRFWIASDGTTAVCHTLTGLELGEVIASAFELDE